MQNANDIIQGAVEAFINKREQLMADRLNFLIEQGVLQVVESQPVVVNDEGKIKITMGLDIRHKGQERLEELVKENQYLKDRLNEVASGNEEV